MSRPKKYPCLFGLVENCEARHFLEEGMAEAKRKAEMGKKIAEAMRQEARVVEHLKFDDAERLKRMIRQLTPAFEDMGLAMARGLGTRFNVMVDFCRMCPKRAREMGEPYSGPAPMPPRVGVRGGWAGGSQASRGR